MSRSSRSSLSRSSSYSDDIDAITPCPPRACAPTSEPEPESTTTSNFPSVLECGTRQSRSPSPSSSVSSTTESQMSEEFNERRRDSLRLLEDGTDGDTERLWRRMLALQQIFGCYKSARMSAALESGDARLLLPSKACLNLLNDNIGMLPSDAEDVIKKCQLRIGY
ncbi:uncharacterized protein BCR38DRAFT_489391 [Pseudomassariella vexata]|uniref:Uncharacterized protein n=1 Tax=Pseudomassariella vexata TaxID=1141098 RepID=A0A1Y2DH92_9PEZI|nr:uncharacterized protein BCR38DRAFT_489391 [Pseudomassariella vexata]ORY58474.1 hypothetical protein BCR38DRAFT_489391 [Pseudomassariella vexata]